MDASNLPKGQSPERTDGRNVNLPGVYVHKGSGQTYITAEGEEGTVQADALMSEKWKGDIWEWTAPVPNRLEIQAMRKVQLAKDTAEEAAQKKADEAEIEALVAKNTKAAKPEKAKELEAVPAPGTGATY